MCVPNMKNTILFQEGGDKFPQDANGKFLYSDVDYFESWQELERLHKEGLLHSVGVSNFNKDMIERILEAGKVVPVINQV